MCLPGIDDDRLSDELQVPLPRSNVTGLSDARGGDMVVTSSSVLQSGSYQRLCNTGGLSSAEASVGCQNRASDSSRVEQR